MGPSLRLGSIVFKLLVRECTFVCPGLFFFFSCVFATYFMYSRAFLDQREEEYQSMMQWLSLASF